MKQQHIYMEIDINTLTPEQSKNIIQSRWVLRDKGNKVRARIVAKGFTETVTDLDDIYASTPIFCVLGTLLTLACSNGWIGLRHFNSIFTCGSSGNSGPLHVPAKGVLQPGGQHRMETAESNLWTTQQPKSMEVLQQIGLHRSTAAPNIYMTEARNCFVLAYVDGLPYLPWRGTGHQQALRPTGTLLPGNTVAFLGRNITNRGDHYEMSLADDYTTTLLTETNLQDSKPAPAPGYSTEDSNSRPRTSTLSRRARSI